MSPKGNDCSTGSCPVPANDGAKPKLINASDLPLHGNPYPPKDVIQDESPSSLELTVRSVRTTLQPFMAPFCAAYHKTSDVLAIGAAHTQSTMANLRENQSKFKNGIIIGGAGLFGLVLARRRGIFKKILYGSVFASGAALACYPREVREKAELALFIAKDKLPGLVQQQYAKLSGSSQSKSSSEGSNDLASDMTKESKS